MTQFSFQAGSRWLRPAAVVPAVLLAGCVMLLSACGGSDGDGNTPAAGSDTGTVTPPVAEQPRLPPTMRCAP